MDIFKRKIDKGEERSYADMGNDGEGFGEEEIVEEGERGVGIDVRIAIRRDEVGEKNVFAIMDDTWLTVGEDEVDEERKMKEAAEMGVQWSRGLEQSMGLIFSWCAVNFRLKVRR